MQLTPNFSLEEFVYSPSALSRKIDNKPTVEQKNNLISLCVSILQPLRERLGYSIHISSGFRCVALNAALKGAKNSQHMSGSAADCINTDGTNKELGDLIIEMGLPFDQIIFEAKKPDGDYKWIHVSHNTTPGAKQRGEKLEAVFINGKATYKPYNG